MLYRTGLFLIFFSLFVTAAGLYLIHDNDLLRTFAPEKFKFKPDMRTKSTLALAQSTILENTVLFSALVANKFKLQKSLKKQIHIANDYCKGDWNALENKINIINTDSALMLTIKELLILSDDIHSVIPIDSITKIAKFYPGNHIAIEDISDLDSFTLSVLMQKTISGKVKIKEIRNTKKFLEFLCSNKLPETEGND